MTYEDVGKNVTDLLRNHYENMSLEELNDVAIFHINKGLQTGAIALDANDTRSIPDIAQIIASLPDAAKYADMALVIGAIKILSDFMLKLIEESKKE